MTDLGPPEAPPGKDSSTAASSVKSDRAPLGGGVGDPSEAFYPEEVVAGSTAGIPVGAAVSVILTILVVILLVLMVTGYNNGIPYLHPGTPPGATIIGDRDSMNFLFANGTSYVATGSTLCPQCPFTVGLGADFTYLLNITNGFQNRSEVVGISAAAPFLVDSWGPHGTQVAGGLTQEFTIIVVAPSQSGVYTLPLVIQSDVA